MPYDRDQDWCETCQQLRLVERQQPLHVAHLLTTIFLCGLWLPIWILWSLVPQPWRCTVCGEQCGRLNWVDWLALCAMLVIMLLLAAPFLIVVFTSSRP